MFNDFARKYLNNQELVKALKDIKEKVLNKKINVIGMDACLMAMFEVAYQIRNYVDYFVASEEVELAEGWKYSGFLPSLLSKDTTSLQLVKNIVASYDISYKYRFNYYTQSAIRLENIDLFKDSFNSFIQQVDKCKKYNFSSIKNILHKARNISTSFSTSDYVDLHSFYYALTNQIDSSLKSSNNYNVNYKQELINLKNILDNNQKILNEVVVANAFGAGFKNIKGLSVYFPTDKMDKSYLKTEFVNDTLWLHFIKSYFIR